MTYKPNLSRSARLSAGSRPSLPGQDPKREEELRIELTQQLQPQGRFEQMWIEDIAYRTAMIEVTRAQIAGCRTRMVRGLLDNLPKARWMLADWGYDAEWFGDALEQKGIKPCILGRKSRFFPVKYGKRRYKRRNRIEIMFGRLKDWRRVATRYDRCSTVFFSALALAATVLFWL